MNMRHAGASPDADRTGLTGDGKSRRDFLQAAATGVAAAALPLTAAAAPTAPGTDPQFRSELEAILARYGSEFGPVREVRTRRHERTNSQEH